MIDIISGIDIISIMHHLHQQHIICYSALVPYHINVLVQDCSISIALAMEILQSCIKPSIYTILTGMCVFLLISNLPWMGTSSVTHMCLTEPVHRCFRLWLVASSAPSHYLSQCWLVVHWALQNKLQVKLESKYFVQEDVFENFVHKLLPLLVSSWEGILSLGRFSMSCMGDIGLRIRKVFTCECFCFSPFSMADRALQSDMTAEYTRP